MSLKLLKMLCSCERIPGDYTGGVPPVPIPNTEVKTSRADDTAPRENRSLPGIFNFLFLILSRKLEFLQVDDTIATKIMRCQDILVSYRKLEYPRADDTARAGK